MELNKSLMGLNKSLVNNRENILQIKNLSYSAGSKQILKEISLSASAGEFIGIIGPNGAGKTSLLKCINRLNQYSGEVIVNGKDIMFSGRKEIAKITALMLQNTHLNFPFTALEVVLMGRYPHLTYGRGESNKDYEIARKCLRYTGTEELEDREVTNMSGGEMQRVLFAKVLAQEAELILLDEPTASLDIAYEEQIFRISSELCRSGRTVIAAVHDIKIAARFCSRLVLMKDGQILADGTAEEVISSDNLSKAFGVNALVYRNRVTGSLDYHIFSDSMTGNGKSVHIIGGGGSASGVIRYLFERGYKLTAGVLSVGDSDLSTAELFDIENVKCMPFSGIDQAAQAANEELVKSADVTVLCNMPFGRQNLGNLIAAGQAKRLLILEDEDAKSRDYTDGEAYELYLRLKANAEVLSTSLLHEVL